jgi:hypothetical protein
VNTTERVRSYRDAGWTEFNPNAPAFTPTEIEAERRRYNTGL